MRLKILTTFVIVLGVAMLFGWPTILRMRPHGTAEAPAPVRLRQWYLVTLGGYVGSTLCCFMTAGALSALMIRRAREEYHELAINNMRLLVEGSLDDLRTKGNSS